MNHKTKFFIAALLPVIVFSIGTLKVFAATNEATVNGGADSCNHTSNSGLPKFCKFTVSAATGYQAYKGVVTATIDGHGAFGEAGGNVSLLGCFNGTGALWQGPCKVMFEEEIGDANNYAVDRTFTFDGSTPNYTETCGGACSKFVMEVYNDDATWHNLKGIVYSRKVEITKPSNDITASRGIDFSVPWNVDQGKNTVFFSDPASLICNADGPVGTIGVNGTATCHSDTVIAYPSGQITVVADGPTATGQVHIEKTVYVTVEGTGPGCLSTEGDSCTSSPNNCGETNPGTIECLGTCSASTPADRASCGGAANGQCAATHYSCIVGNSGSPVESSTAWTWSCNGLNGGTNDSCSESKCIPPTTGVMTAPASAAVNSTFEIMCDYGSVNDYIPAPAGCTWPGSGGGHVGTAATFTCTAPATAQSKTYTCAPSSPAGPFTNFCTVPTPVSKTVSITGASQCPPISNCQGTTLGGPPGMEMCQSNTTSRICQNDLTWSAAGATSNCTGLCNVVNGACSSAHYNCAAGTSVSNTSGSTAWTWSCDGSGTGHTNASCSESKPVNGGWSAWGACSVTACGQTGTQSRTCTNPTPSGAGADCSSLDGGNSSRSCSTAPCPTGTISATSCSVACGASTCNSAVTWTTTNLTSGATEVTRNNPAGTLVSSATSGTNVSNIVNFGPSAFFLYHNLYGTPTSLDSTNINASCASGGTWDGGACSCGTGSSMSGTLTPAVNSCDILSGQSACNINFSWTTTNPLGLSKITRDSDDAVVADTLSGNIIPFVIKYNTETFRLFNNSIPLAMSTVTSRCVLGTAWDGTKCVPPPPGCGNAITVSPEQCDLGSSGNGACPRTCSDSCTTNVCTPPPTVNINVNPTSIYTGSSATLTWNSNGSSCTGVNFNTGGATSGSITVSPVSTVNYKITCVSGAQSSTNQVTLVVKKKPIIIEQ